MSCTIARLALQPGKILALHHRLPFSGDIEGIRGSFRELIHFSPGGEPELYACDRLLKPSTEPTCFLAPSIDDGQTRRLIAIAQVDADAQWTLPLASSLDDPSLSDQIARGLAIARDSHDVEGCDIVRNTPGKGRGVFAHRAYAQGEVVGAFRAACVRADDVPRQLADYVYASKAMGTRLFVYGHGSLFNHGDSPAMEIEHATAPTRAGEASTLTFRAIRPILQGEELTHSYGESWWKTRRLLPV